MEQAQLFYTRNDVEKAIRKAVAAHPNRRNPRIGGTCVYTGARGSHCIAGEVLWMLGQDIPQFGDSTNTGHTVRDLFHEQEDFDWPMEVEAVDLLNMVQLIFDGVSSTPPMWNDALRMAERDGVMPVE